MYTKPVFRHADVRFCARVDLEFVARALKSIIGRGRVVLVILMCMYCVCVIGWRSRQREEDGKWRGFIDRFILGSLGLVQVECSIGRLGG